MDDDFWTRERQYGGMVPLSLTEMREHAHGVQARTVLTSAGERDMAAAVLHLLDELARAHRG